MTDEMILVPRAELLAWAQDWLRENDPGDDTDVVTPFDTYLLKSPAEAHCATCSCVPGMTPAVRFDATPAEKEGAVRDHLIRMGWTPPAEAQPAPYNRKRIAWELERTAMGDGYYGGALRAAKEFPEATPSVRSLLDRWATGKQSGLSDQTDLCAFALRIYAAEGEPPSAPVGVKEMAKAIAAEFCPRGDYEHGDVIEAIEYALAQQPAAADGVKCPWDGGSPCVEPMPAGMVYPKKPAPRAGGYLDTSGVEWNAWDAGQMEAYARAAYSDGWEAGYRAALRDHDQEVSNG